MLLESFNRSVEKECPDEQDEEDNVGEGGGEVDDFPARLDPLGEAREHDDPRQQDAETVIVVIGVEDFFHNSCIIDNISTFLLAFNSKYPRV